MKGNVAALAGLSLGTLLCGCAKTYRSANEFIGFGVYSTRPIVSAGERAVGAPSTTIKLSLNQNRTYSKRRYQGGCLLLETKGTWSCDMETIEFRLRETRWKENCHGEWKTGKSAKTVKKLIRNVAVTSFEILDEGGNNPNPEWIPYAKRQP